jgi:hypothetical protein
MLGMLGNPKMLGHLGMLANLGTVKTTTAK